MHVSLIVNQAAITSLPGLYIIVDNRMYMIQLCETWLSSEKEKKICGDILCQQTLTCVNRRRTGAGVALMHRKTIALSEFKNITTS